MTESKPVREGEPLYEPSAAEKRDSNLTRYMEFLWRTRNQRFDNYAELQAWSVREIADFWRSIWDYFEIFAHVSPAAVLVDEAMPNTRWFEGATLNYAEHALKRTDGTLAVIACNEAGARVELSYATLADRVARARAGLQKLGVGKGDRVAAFLPNVPETLIAFLATASLGALWSSCSPDFGVQGVLDRFRQIEPKVLLSVDAYSYGGKKFDRRDAVRDILAGLPSVESCVVLSAEGVDRISGVRSIGFDELLSERKPLAFEAVPFDHPLWILYSSGTTGLPKPIVQGHGGILLEHLKALSLHSDLKAGDRFFWFTTTGWMMYNFLISGLLVGATVVLYDGSPAFPDLMTLWRLAEREQIGYFGTSAPFLQACQKRRLKPRATCDLSLLKTLGTTGAPLPADGFGWVYENVSNELLLASISGGTDVCTAFVLSCPLLPVHAGEIQCAGLGADVKAFDDQGHAIVGQVGELVLTRPLPSMPLFFWGDDDGSRLREAYFVRYPGVWHHGDFVKFTERGSCIIYGRSDATLNRGGVRMGTSDFYRIVEALPEVADSLVIDTAGLDDADGKLWLFIVPASSLPFHEICSRIKAVLKSELSPRHVPDEIRAIEEVPRTLSGKKLEVPIKRILAGKPAEEAVNYGTLKNPTALGFFVKLTQDLRRT